MRLLKQNFLLNLLRSFLIDYPVPSNINYFYNFGVLAGISLIIQIITGIFLAMYYIPNGELAFLSVEHIMRDVNNGWFIRYLHANGASFFFITVYLHMFRGLYYNSYMKPRELLWCVGVIISVIMILTAFLGYVLPWGQMSFWAATVITNLFSAFPIIGNYIVIWLWGAFSVGTETLNRFYSFHYLFPFILVFLSIIHLLILHINGSTNPLAIETNKYNQITFHPYFTIKDLLSFFIFLIFYLYFVFFEPNLLGHTDNYIQANPLVTPTHIVPEWYFLPFYAILRSIPDKLLGVLALAGALISLLILPFIIKNQFRIYFIKFSYYYKIIIFWFFLITCVLLGWIGGKPIEEPYLEIGQFLTICYFFYFISISIINNFFIWFFHWNQKENFKYFSKYLVLYLNEWMEERTLLRYNYLDNIIDYQTNSMDYIALKIQPRYLIIKKKLILLKKGYIYDAKNNKIVEIDEEKW